MKSLSEILKVLQYYQGGLSSMVLCDWYNIEFIIFFCRNIPIIMNSHYYLTNNNDIETIS